MPRLTITLSNDRHRALKQAAASRGRSIGELIEASLDFYGIKTGESAADLVARARARAGLSEDAALALGVKETRAERRRPCRVPVRAPASTRVSASRAHQA